MSGYLGDLRIPAIIVEYGTAYEVEELRRDADTISYRLTGPPRTLIYKGPWHVLTFPC